jgi:hypothetical protein
MSGWNSCFSFFCSSSCSRWCVVNRSIRVFSSFRSASYFEEFRRNRELYCSGNGSSLKAYHYRIRGQTSPHHFRYLLFIGLNLCHSLRILFCLFHCYRYCHFCLCPSFLPFLLALVSLGRHWLHRFEFSNLVHWIG